MTKKHNTRQLIVNLQDIKWAQWVRGLSENYLRDLYHWWSSCHLCLVTVGMIPTPAKQDHQGPDNLSDFPFFILVNGNWLKAQLRREASSGSKKYWANSMLDMLTVRQEKFQMGFLFKNRKKKQLTSVSDFASGFAWATGVIALAFTSGRPCEFPTPATVLVADTVLVMGLTWAAGVEVRLLLLTSRACDGAIGNSRKLLFLGAVGCSCWFGRLTIFCEGVFWKAERKKNADIATPRQTEVIPVLDFHDLLATKKRTFQRGTVFSM